MVVVVFFALWLDKTIVLGIAQFWSIVANFVKYKHRKFHRQCVANMKLAREPATNDHIRTNDKAKRNRPKKKKQNKNDGQQHEQEHKVSGEATSRDQPNHGNGKKSCYTLLLTDKE